MREEVPSPCNKICQLNAGQVCIGCGRNLDEIAIWSGASRKQRLQIRALAAARLAAIDLSSPSRMNPEQPQ